MAPHRSGAGNRSAVANDRESLSLAQGLPQRIDRLGPPTSIPWRKLHPRTGHTRFGSESSHAGQSMHRSVTMARTRRQSLLNSEVSMAYLPLARPCTEIGHRSSSRPIPCSLTRSGTMFFLSNSRFPYNRALVRIPVCLPPSYPNSRLFGHPLEFDHARSSTCFPSRCSAFQELCSSLACWVCSGARLLLGVR